MSEIPQQNTFEDQRKQALELYENMVKECPQWSSFIQRAIESYNPDLQAQLSAKEQECEQLKESVKEWSEHAECRQCTINNQNAELSSLRSENERLKKTVPDLGDQILGLRKRCEDLEAALKGIDSSLYIVPDLNDEEILKFYVNVCGTVKEEIQKLLNQIKS